MQRRGTGAPAGVFEAQCEGCVAGALMLGGEVGGGLVNHGGETGLHFYWVGSHRSRYWLDCIVRLDEAICLPCAPIWDAGRTRSLLNWWVFEGVDIAGQLSSCSWGLPSV